MEVNPENGRMRKKCVPPQVRNPLTGRCKKPSESRPAQTVNESTGPNLRPCPPGKERNAAGNCVKACVHPQIRNPLTGRCKKTNVSFFNTDENKEVDDILDGDDDIHVREYTSDKNAQAKFSDLIENLPSVSKQDVCIGHAMSVTYGDKLMGLRKDVKRNEYILKVIYDYMVRSLSPTFKKGEVIHFEPSNVNAQSTRICMFKKGVKTYIWYSNPWGSRADLEDANDPWRSSDDSDHPKAALNEKTQIGILANIKTRDVNSLDKAFGRITGDDLSKLYEYTMAFQGIYSQTLIRTFVMKHEQEINNKTRKWANRSSEVEAFNHVMAVIYMFKLIIEKNHSKPDSFEVIHPVDSMPHEGLQSITKDGIFDIAKKCNMDLGACAVWSELYIEWADMLLKRDSNVMRVLHHKLPFIGDISRTQSRYILGRYYITSMAQALSKQEGEKQILNASMKINSFDTSSEGIMRIFEDFYDHLDEFNSTSFRDKAIVQFNRVLPLVNSDDYSVRNSTGVKTPAGVATSFFIELDVPIYILKMGTNVVDIIISTCLLLIDCHSKRLIKVF